MRLLLVEDDTRIARFVARGLQEQSYAVDVVAGGNDALYQVEINDYDLVILDVMIPGKDGFATCRAIRGLGKHMPILMLTARDAVDDRIKGLDCGADDYLTKPFEFGELLARLRALLRRPNELHAPQIVVGELTLDTASQTAKRGNKTIVLTAKEYALLEFLARNAGRVVGRSEIAEHVWDENFDPFSNLIEVYVNRLRRKLGDDDGKPLLQTRRGSGYILGVPPEGKSTASSKPEAVRRAAGSMLDSIRVRLTLWYTLVLGLVLVFLAGVTYFLYWRNVTSSTDASLTELANAFATTFQAELADADEPDGAKGAAQESMIEHRFRGTVFVILDSSGAQRYSSFELAPRGFSREHLNPALLQSKAFLEYAARAVSKPDALETIDYGRDGFRALAKAIPWRNETFTAVVLQSLHQQQDLLEDIRETFYWAIPLALLLASLGGYVLARKSLAPVAAMASQARTMGADNLRDRLEVANQRDELGQLALSFNQLLARLEASFEQQRRFVADASHELRTPVAILRGEAEVTLSRVDRSPEEYRETLAILRDESQRLAHIIEDLFTLTRADAGQYPLTPRDGYLDELASEALVRARSLALAKNITLRSAIEPDLPICGDESLLGRMLLNLLDNAIKYSPPGGTVELACARSAESYVIRVSDNGPGIPPELQERVFERFFRADKARSRSEGGTGGAGLGLAIARWIAEAHHGRLELTRSDSSGSTFSIHLSAPNRHNLSP